MKSINTILSKIIPISFRERLGSDALHQFKQFYIQNVQPTSATHSLGEILGEKIDVSIPFPKPVETFIGDPDELEKECMDFRETFGLYKQNPKIPEVSKFGYLTWLTTPFSEKGALVSISKYFLALFDLDDDIDEIGMTKQKHETSIKDILGIWDGLDPRDLSVPRTKGIDFVYKKSIKPIIEDHGTNTTFVKESCRQYLYSTLQEVSQESVNSEDQLALRQHTGGIRHAIGTQAIHESIDVQTLIKENFELENMIRAVADCVGLLNDILSLKKEIKAIKLEMKAAGEDPNDETLFKERIKSNYVLILHKEGKSIREAVEQSLETYSKKLASYGNMKETLFKRVDNQLSKPMVKLLFILEAGWLSGHPVWGMLSRRYNAEDGLTKENVVRFIASLK